MKEKNSIVYDKAQSIYLYPSAFNQQNRYRYKKTKQHLIFCLLRILFPQIKGLLSFIRQKELHFLMTVFGL